MLMDMSAAYVDEIEEGLRGIRAHLDGMEAEDEIRALMQTVALLETAGRGQRAPAKREEMLNKAQAYRRELEQLLDESQKASLLSTSTGKKKKGAGGRKTNGGGGGGGGGGKRGGGGDENEEEEGDDDEDDVEEQNQRALANSRSAIERSLKNTAEMEVIGANILANLDDQDATISSAMEKVGKTQSLTTRARAVVRNIEKRDFKQKMVMYGAVFFVVLLVAIALYVMFK